MNKPELIIEADRAQKDYLKDVVLYRELFYFFTWRDLLVRYKQAFFGIAWALFRPLLTMALFTFIFSRLANFPSDGVPYPLFALAGMIPWLLFANTLAEVPLCLLNNPHLVAKVYFPRIIIPASQIFVQFADFLIALILLFALILYMGDINFFTFVCLPLIISLLLLLCLGVSLFLSALVVKYRDVRYVIPFFVQFGMYLSPVGYGSFMIPEKWQWVYFLNPMAGIIEGFRWSLFGVTPPYLLESMLISAAVTGVILAGGYIYFRNRESQFGDMI
jgi:lipopolysaccharide transport system permease protein